MNPETNMTQKEKNLLIKNHKKSNEVKSIDVSKIRQFPASFVKNQHEKDALAAALRAMHEYTNLFARIDQKLGRKKLSFMCEDVKELILKRKAGNIAHAVRQLTIK